jgi:ABC-2 type transport system ATP-binding protein
MPKKGAAYMQNKEIVRINSLKVQFGDFTALNITEPITIERGDRLGIIGSNGAGKTTLVKALLKVVKSRGDVQMNVPMEKIAVHMQQNGYTNLLKVEDIMETVLGCKLKDHKKAMELVEFFNFKSSLNKKFQHLSGGQQQRLTLILVLSQESELVIFDEVTTGLDFVTRQELMELLKKWYKGKDTSICYITHYYEELENMSNKLLLLDKGRVIDYGRQDELFKKYCGNGIIIIENNEKNSQLAEDFKQISSVAKEIALSFNNYDEEIAIIKRLAQNGVDYKRSSTDIEIMYTNAIKTWEENYEAV